MHCAVQAARIVARSPKPAMSASALVQLSCSGESCFSSGGPAAVQRGKDASVESSTPGRWTRMRVLCAVASKGVQANFRRRP